MGFGTVNVGTSATKILGENTRRQSLILTNASTSGIVYLGPDSTITSATAIVLQADGNLTEDSSGGRMYKGDIWGMTTSANGTADVAYWERTGNL